MTVACVFVDGPYPYTPEYVYRLQKMVSKHLDRPHRFVCLTDRPSKIPGVECRSIASLNGTVPENGVGYWNKMRLYDKAMGFSGRVLFLDLDTLAVNSLEPIVDFPSDFAIVSDELKGERPPNELDKYGRVVLRQWNASVMAFDADKYHHLWTDWKPEFAQKLSTDQDYLAQHLDGADHGMPAEWFPRISRVQPPWPAEAKVVLVKKPKNHEAVKVWDWFDEAWG